MTEHHVVLLLWKARPRRSFTLGEVKDRSNEDARRSTFYGQPVFEDKSELNDAVLVHGGADFSLFAERADREAFQLAHLDLVAMGLFKPILKKEIYLEGRVEKRRTTPDIVGYEVSSLGKSVANAIAPVS